MKKICVLLLVLGCGCYRYDPSQDGQLHLSRKPYTGNQLRLDGYYSGEYLSGEMVDNYFLYENGIIFYANSTEKNNLDNHEKNFTDLNYIKVSKQTKPRWGVFEVEGAIIRFSRWTFGEPPVTAALWTGKVLSETSFVITEVYSSGHGKRVYPKDKQIVYNLRSFSPKPDSSNPFID